MDRRSTTTDAARRLWNAYAPKYDSQIGFFERVLFSGGRAWACSRARGSTLELAIGTGRNLSFYPPGVRVTGVELSEQMLAIAKQRAASVRPDAVLVWGDAQALPFEDESFDTVLVTLAMCSIPNPSRAVAEAKRVLRPGGRFVAVEHVGSPNPLVRSAQRAIEALTFRWTGDHQTREPLEYLGRSGFVTEEVQRLKWGIVERVQALAP